jgi:hypothetical protein
VVRHVEADNNQQITTRQHTINGLQNIGSCDRELRKSSVRVKFSFALLFIYYVRKE